jgi:hypothetical protein
MIPKKKIILINNNKIDVSSDSLKNDYVYYYLSNDYLKYIELKNKYKKKIEINNLAGLFNETLLEIKDEYLKAIGKINNEFNSLGWWGTVIASKSSSVTPAFQNIIYLICAKKIINNLNNNIVFIIDNYAIAKALIRFGQESGLIIKNNTSRWNHIGKIARGKMRLIVHILRYIFSIYINRKYANKYLGHLKTVNNIKKRKRIVIRSWVTDDSLMKYNNKDRNFGELPNILRDLDYDVWNMPIFYNLKTKTKIKYSLLFEMNIKILSPYHYLKPIDYFNVLLNSLLIMREKVDNVFINGIDVSSIINETIKRYSFSSETATWNLCYPMLNRLSKAGFEIDEFHYAFENLSAEKQFIMGCNNYYSNSTIIGFQHTAYYPNLLAWDIKYEQNFHPIPNKLICSAPIYNKILNDNGFPKNIIESGPNLRIENANMEYQIKSMNTNNKKNLLIPFTFDINMAFELLYKIHQIMDQLDGYKIYIKTHPLIEKDKILRFLSNINFGNYKLIETGSIQSWLSRMYATITSGGSITTVESATMGIPVIRLIPDNSIHLDSLFWPDYPLSPINSPSKIIKQFNTIDTLLDSNKDHFNDIGKKVKSQYFSSVNNNRIKVFLNH